MKGKGSSSLLSLIASIVLLSIVLFQTQTVFTGYARLWLSRTWRTRHLTSMERNALFLYGNKGAEFIKFMSRAVPFDKPIVLPTGYDIFSEQNLLQFFLFPRAIVGCPCPSFLEDDTASRACASCLSDPERAVPAIGPFPPEDLLGGGKRFIRFPASEWYRGIFVPSPTIGNPSEPFLHMGTPIPIALLIDVLLLVMLFVVGAGICASIDSRLEWKDLLVLSIPIGGGTVTFSLFVYSWVGGRITLVSFVAAMAILLVGCVASRVAIGRRFLPPLSDFPRPLSLRSVRRRPLTIVVASILAVLAVWATAIAIGAGYSLYDGIANWALKGYAIAETGSVTAGSRWGGHVLSYPQNIHLLIALFRLADGDVLPGSKSISLMFTLSLLAGCYVFWRRHGVSEEISALFVALLFSAPIIFVHSTIGWGNLPFSAYIVLGVLYSVYALESRRTSAFWVPGLLIAFGAWTRPEGVGYAVALGALVFVATLLLRLPGWAILAWSVPTLVVAAIWGQFGLPWISADEIGQVTTTFLSSLAEGELRPEILGYLVSFAVKRLTVTSIWGLLLVSAFLLLAGGVFRPRGQSPLHVNIVIAASTISFLIPLFMFYVAALAKSDVAVFLDVSFDRAHFHAVILLLVASVASFAGAPRKTMCDSSSSAARGLADVENERGPEGQGALSTGDGWASNTSLPGQAGGVCCPC